LEVANQVCGFLSVGRAESLIQSAIEAQGFAVKKKEFEEAGKKTGRDFCVGVKLIHGATSFL
jgi:hypothetical protein